VLKERDEISIHHPGQQLNLLDARQPMAPSFKKRRKKKFSPVSGVNTAHILEMIGLMLEQSGGVRSRRRRRSQNNVPLAISSGFLF
jgi:hypothetical protein